MRRFGEVTKKREECGGVREGDETKEEEEEVRRRNGVWGKGKGKIEECGKKQTGKRYLLHFQKLGVQITIWELRIETPISQNNLKGPRKKPHDQKLHN